MSRTIFKPLDDTSNIINRSDVKILSINNKSQLFDIGREADYKFILTGSNYIDNNQLMFVEIISRKLYNNLFLLSSDLPEITANLLKISYELGVNKLSKVVEKLVDLNPLSYPIDHHHPYYAYKIKKMLLAMAQGIGDNFHKTDVFGTSFLKLKTKIIDKSITYHVYDMQQFGELIFKHSYLSPDPIHHINKIGKKYITLNLNIHF